MKKYILLILLFVLALNATAQKTEDASAPKQLAQDSITNIIEHRYNTILFQLSQDSTMQKQFEGDELDLKIINSPDGKIRVASWAKIKNDSASTYEHVMQYYVSETKTVLSLLPQEQQSTSLYASNNGRSVNVKDYDKPKTVTKIHPIKDGIYLVESYGNQSKILTGVDLGRGLASPAYLFRNKNNESERGYTKVMVEGLNIAYMVEGLRLLSTNGKDTLIFNGTNYEDEQIYWNRFDGTENGEKPSITSIYFTNVDTNTPVSSMSPNQKMTLKVDMAYKDNTLIAGTLYPVRINNKKDEQGQKIAISLPLIVLKNRVFVEGFNFRDLAMDSIKGDVPLTKILNSAGRRYGYTYQWLRYSALVFDRQPTNEDDYKRIRWMLEVDGKEQMLDSTRYNGTQIDLLMDVKWGNSTIAVTPYIEGCAVNRDVSIKTAVLGL